MLAQLAAVHDSIVEDGNAVIGVGPAATDQAAHLRETTIPFDLYLDRAHNLNDRLGTGRQSLARFILWIPQWFRYLRDLLRNRRQYRITGHFSNLCAISVVDARCEVTYVHRCTGVGDYPPLSEVMEALEAV